MVDSRTVAGAYGYAVLRALELLEEDPNPERVVECMRRVCERATLYFYIPTLDALRRGGRVSPALAMVGQMFQIKPIGTISQGKLTYVERPRTAARALDRFVELTVQACREHRHAAALDASTDAVPGSDTPGEVVAVHHVGNAAQAVQLYERVQRLLGEGSLSHSAGASTDSASGEGSVALNIPEFLVSSLPPVLSAHSGLGAVAMVVY